MDQSDPVSNLHGSIRNDAGSLPTAGNIGEPLYLFLSTGAG